MRKHNNFNKWINRKIAFLFLAQPKKASIGLLLIIALFMSNQALAQRGLTNGIPKWIGGNGKLFTIGAKVGIGTNEPIRSLHNMGAGHRYMRTTSTGGTQYSTYVAGLELQRILDNGQSLTWDIVNQGGFKIRRNTSTLFHLQQDQAQLGTQANKTTMYIWGRPILGGLDEGSLTIRNYLAGQYQTVRLDGDQLESETDFHINFSSDKDVSLVQGGGKVRINSLDDEAQVNVESAGMHLKLKNSGAAWRIGVSNDDWLVGEGKLVFTKTTSSNDATMVMTQAGNVGIGVVTPSRTLHVNGTTRTSVLEITGGADLAEPFTIADENTIQPGYVVSIDAGNTGHLKIANQAYDKTVAGIVSGAGDIQPGMVMGQDGTIANGEYPVALSGRVYCRVDAAYGAIQPGDLLTTSNTPGHAMKVSDSSQALGAIIGKAMTALESGQGLVLVLVSLQ